MWPFNPTTNYLLQRLLKQGNLIMTSQAELAVQIDALTAQTAKIIEEVQVASASLRIQIAALEEALGNASTDAIPVLEAAVASLKETLQVLDDVNPDNA